MKTYGKLTIPDFAKVHDKSSQYLQVSGESLNIVHQIESQLCRLAPHYLWLAIPRGDISQWRTKEKWKKEMAFKYEEEWSLLFPQDVEWYMIIYAGRPEIDFHAIQLSDGRENLIEFASTSNGLSVSCDPRSFLEKLLDSVKEIMDDICADPAAYNDFLATHLPLQYRSGRIARKDLERVAPFCKLDIKEPELARAVLKKIIAKKFPPKKDLTLREYLRYFHIAGLAFYNALPEGFEGMDQFDEIDDIGYFSLRFGELFDNLDDPDNMEKIKFDHYGEIGQTRLCILAEDTQEGTLIRVHCAYAMYLEKAINVAVALYKAGAPLDMRPLEAGTMLSAVDGTDEIRVRPNTYHDAIGSDCEGCGGTISIPFEYELKFEGDNKEWTEESLRNVVRLTKWDKLEEILPVQ